MNRRRHEEGKENVGNQDKSMVIACRVASALPSERAGHIRRPIELLLYHGGKPRFRSLASAASARKDG